MSDLFGMQVPCNKTNSETNCSLENEWKKQADHVFSYFVIFDINPVEGSSTLDKAKELIGGM